MATLSHLIIGLGNPGDEYAGTRHNIGFMALDAIASRYRCEVWKKKFRSLVASADGFLLAKPQTFMNLSGEAALEARQFYQLKSEQIIVFHDDLDLPPGHVKIKQGGGSGGHNGLKSLDSYIGQDYWRVRLGIGRPLTEQGLPVKGDAVSHFVLHNFAKAERSRVDQLTHDIGRNFDLMLKGDHAAYASALNTNEL